MLQPVGRGTSGDRSYWRGAGEGGAGKRSAAGRNSPSTSTADATAWPPWRAGSKVQEGRSPAIRLVKGSTAFTVLTPVTLPSGLTAASKATMPAARVL